MKQKTISLFFLTVLMLSIISGCSTAAPTATQPAATIAEATAVSTAVQTQESTVDTTKDDAYAKVLTFNNSAWQYDATNNVYW